MSSIRSRMAAIPADDPAVFADAITRTSRLPGDYRATARELDRIRRGYGAAGVGVSVQIDLAKLKRWLELVDIKSGNTAIYRGINEGIDRLYTILKREVQKWTGIRVQERASRGFRKQKAYAGRLEGRLIVKDEYTVITAEYYGATWNRSMPGVQHRAWNRLTMAKGAFMVPGYKPAFRRVGPKRLPIVTLFGPNPAREIERHEKEVNEHVDRVTVQYVMPEITRQIKREMERRKKQLGL